MATSLKEPNAAKVDYDDKTSAYTSAGIDQAEAFANDPNNSSEVTDSDSLRDGEESGGGGWKNNVPNSAPTKTQGFTTLLKKRGGSFGLIGALLAALGFGGAALGPPTMLSNITENLFSTQDSASTSMEARLSRAFQGMIDPSSNLCRTKINCKMGKISNSGLNRLSKAGIVAEWDDGTKYNGKRTGHPTDSNGKRLGNPTKYRIAGVAEPINAANLTKYLADNPKIGYKVLGAKGLINMRFNTWAGNHISKMFKGKFGVTKSGGIADGKHGEGNDKNSRLKSKLASAIKPPNNSAAGDNIKNKLGKRMGKAGKGGIAYTVALSSCLAVKIPTIVAASIAAVHLTQMIPLVNDILLSPGSKLKSGQASPEDMDNIGSLLTESTPRASDNKRTSALDSPILLSAMGVNSKPTGLSSKFTPGYNILTSDFFKNAKNIESASDSTCNVIMSPITMYTAMAAQTAVSATGVGVIATALSVAGGFAIGKGIELIVEHWGADILADAIAGFSKIEGIEDLRGEELGDALGISAMAFFGAGNAASGLGVLSMSQVQEFAQIKDSVDAEQARFEIAALSPFDTSSKYTFLGSIVNKISNSMLANGLYDLSPKSILSTIAKAPFMYMSQNTSAKSSELLANSCGYASEFGLDSSIGGQKDPSLTPAINAAGLPCMGIVREQVSMGSDEAIQILVAEGFFDEGKEIKDNDTIQDLVSSGYIKQDTLLYDFITDCMDVSTGNYMTNSAGCILKTTYSSTAQAPCLTTVNEEGSPVEVCVDSIFSEEGDENPISTDVKLPESDRIYHAMSVFVMDYQIISSINGENEADYSASPSSTGLDLDTDALYQDSVNISCDSRTSDAGTDTGYRKKVAVNIRLCSIPELGSIKFNSRISATTANLVRDLKAAGIPFKATSGFRTMASQQALYLSWQRGTGNPAAEPGTSNHQMGLAIDMKFYNSDGVTEISNSTSKCVRVSGVCTAGDSPGYDWMVANASKYGFTQFKDEFWHWEVEAK